MAEENQMQMSQASTPLNNDIRDRLAWLRQHREQFKMRKAVQTQNDLDAASNNFYDQSLNVTNKNLSQAYNMSGQSAAAASMIKSYAEKNWDDWSDLNTPQEILTEYFRINPDDETYNKIINFTKSSQDPEEFWLEMWWIEKDWFDKVWDWIKNVWKNFLSFYESWGEAVRNIVNGSIEEMEQWTVLNPSETDYTASARENYAHMNYGKDYYSLSPDEKAEADAAISTKEWMDTYKPTAQRATLKAWEAGLDAFFTTIAPAYKLWFSAADETPYVNMLTQWLGKVVEFWGWVVNHVTPLYFFRDSLQTDQEKEEFDSFVGSFWLMKLLQKRESWSRWGARDTIIKEIDPMTTIKEFQKRVQDLPWDVKNFFKKSWEKKVPVKTTRTAKLQELRDTNKSLSDEADIRVTRIIKGNKKADANTRSNIAKWLSELTEEEASTYKSASEALLKKWKEQKKLIDDTLSKDTKTYGTEDVMLKQENSKTGKTTSTNVFDRMLDKLIAVYEERPNEKATYEYYKEKIANWEATLRDLNDIDRAFNNEFSEQMYKELWWEKAWLNADDARKLRTSGKRVIRNLWKETGIEELSYDNLKALDEKYSALIDAQKYIDRVASDKANFDATRHVKTEWEIIWDALWRGTKALGAAKNLDVAWVQNAFSRWIPESATFAELEAELPTSVSRIKEITKSMSENNKSIKSMERLDFSTEWEWFSKLRSKKADYMIVSAENPMWKQESPEYNAAKTKAFRDFLDENGIAWKAQKGMYDNPENSQIIAIDNPQQRIIIDEWLEKNSPQNENIIIKWGEAYRYDPRTKKAYKTDLTKADVDLPAETDNFYSELDGKKYQIPLWTPNDVKVTKKNFLSVYNK